MASDLASGDLASGDLASGELTSDDMSGLPMGSIISYSAVAALVGFMMTVLCVVKADAVNYRRRMRSHPMHSSTEMESSTANSLSQEGTFDADNHFSVSTTRPCHEAPATSHEQRLHREPSSSSSGVSTDDEGTDDLYPNDTSPGTPISRPSNRKVVSFEFSPRLASSTAPAPPTPSPRLSLQTASDRVLAQIRAEPPAHSPPSRLAVLAQMAIAAGADDGDFRASVIAASVIAGAANDDGRPSVAAGAIGGALGAASIGDADEEEGERPPTMILDILDQSQQGEAQLFAGPKAWVDVTYPTMKAVGGNEPRDESASARDRSAPSPPSHAVVPACAASNRTAVGVGEGEGDGDADEIERQMAAFVALSRPRLADSGSSTPIKISSTSTPDTASNISGCRTASFERRTSSSERRTPSSERRTSSFERRKKRRVRFECGAGELGVDLQLDIRGQLVASGVHHGSIAWRRGVRVGAVLSEVNGRSTKWLSHDQAMRMVMDGGVIAFTISSQTDDKHAGGAVEGYATNDYMYSSDASASVPMTVPVAVPSRPKRVEMESRVEQRGSDWL